MATMQDVAVRAGVSIATVSFVVNGTKRVSPETTARITAAMAELGFRRNVIARALASRQTRIIALLFPPLRHRLDGFINGAAHAAHTHGYNLVLWPVSNDADQMMELVDGGLADGVLLMEVLIDDPRVARLVERGTPFALIGRTADPAALPYVDMDFDLMIDAAMQYLTGLGHSRIALVGEELSDPAMVGYGPRVRTEAAFRAAMSARGSDPVVLHSPTSPQGGRAAAVELLRVAPDTSAVIIMNEDAAPGLVSGLARAGRRVPDDISVLSVATGPEMGAMSDPILSTMDAPGTELGTLGVEALIDQLEGRTESLPQLLLPVPLNVAESTGPASS
jgi:DNA-binding LacI/PurR family transcriptional regulator